MLIVANPRTFKIPDWFLNRQKDHKDGRNSQLTSSQLDTKLREDLERLKKIRYVLPPSASSNAEHANITKMACAISPAFLSHCSPEQRAWGSWHSAVSFRDCLHFKCVFLSQTALHLRRGMIC